MSRRVDHTHRLVSQRNALTVLQQLFCGTVAVFTAEEVVKGVSPSVGQHDGILAVDHQGNAEPVSEGIHRGGMVKMAVGQENACHGDTESVGLGQNGICRMGGVYHKGKSF